MKNRTQSVCSLLRVATPSRTKGGLQSDRAKGARYEPLTFRCKTVEHARPNKPGDRSAGGELFDGLGQNGSYRCPGRATGGLVDPPEQVMQDEALEHIPFGLAGAMPAYSGMRTESSASANGRGPLRERSLSERASPISSCHGIDVPPNSSKSMMAKPDRETRRLLRQ